MRIDNEGDFWLFTAVAATVGAVVGATSQIITNVASGDKWSSGVLGAAVGGAVYNTIAVTTFNTTAASFASAAAESFTNETIKYVSGKKKRKLQ